MSETRAAELGITPLARILSTGVSAISPEIMGVTPIEASRRALANAGLEVGDVDLVEINEAFASQVIPSIRELGFDESKVNVHGGAIAIGHPFGMTGARIATTLLQRVGVARRRNWLGDHVRGWRTGHGDGLAKVVLTTMGGCTASKVSCPSCTRARLSIPTPP